MQKYSAYDRELLAIYEAVKHFRHMLEARYLMILPTTSNWPTLSPRGATRAAHYKLIISTSFPSSRRISDISPGKTMWSPMLCLTWTHSAHQSLLKLWPKRKKLTLN